jgi:hypothetical protein
MQRADARRFHYIYKITRDDGRYYEYLMRGYSRGRNIVVEASW